MAYDRQMPNAMTVDVEDWHNTTVHQVSGLVIAPSDSVNCNTRRMFELFQEYGVRATWFFLGEVAERFPGLVRMVAEHGHEVGVHGYHHHDVAALPDKEYEESLRKAKDVVEQAGGIEVLGYRAPNFSINRNTWYAFDVLKRIGFRYDSSLFPCASLRYGIGDAPLDAHWIKTMNGNRVYEVPVSVGQMLGVRVPALGGGYFRLFPYLLTKLIMQSVHSRGYPAVFYVHPCELDSKNDSPSLPCEMPSDAVAKYRTAFSSEIINRRRTEAKLRRLFSIYRFSSIRDVFRIDQLDSKCQRDWRESATFRLP